MLRVRRAQPPLEAALLEHAPRVEKLITSESWWDSVGALAHSVGEMVRRHPDCGPTWTGGWSPRTCGSSVWRSFTNWPRRRPPDPDWLFAACAARAHETEFFIRKAIGWALREYSKSDAPAVTGFVAEHADLLSVPLPREALKWLNRRAAATSQPEGVTIGHSGFRKPSASTDSYTRIPQRVLPPLFRFGWRPGSRPRKRADRWPRPSSARTTRR